LSSLTKKQDTKFHWTPEAQTAFVKLKEALCLVPVLAFPQPGQLYTLDTDASDVAVGAALSQVVDGEERPIAFFHEYWDVVNKAIVLPITNYWQLFWRYNIFAIICWEPQFFCARTMPVSNG